MIRALAFLSLLMATPLAAQPPLRQATEGCLRLKVPAGQPPLTGIRAAAGRAIPATWEKDPAVRERTTSITFPITGWSWREEEISFTPTADGTLDLILTGQWEQDSSGVRYRKEILWDGIEAEGATIGNGGFEASTDGKPAGWNVLYGNYPAADEWPLNDAEAFDGKAVGASWLDRPLARTLTVKAGQPVTLKLRAKAATLPGFVAPKRLGQDTPAHRALAGIKRGINLGNCWEAPPPYTWGIRFVPEDIDRIAAEGFDHIRVPVAWHFHMTPADGGYQINPALLADLEPVLRRALEKGMRVLIDWHNFDDLTADPAAHRARFTACWEAIARHFASWPPELFLELLNEPRDALTTEAANPIYAETIAAIHRIDPQRILVVSPGNWGSIRELEKLALPDGDDRVIVTVHCYEPFHFTHQGAGWVQLRPLRGIAYPGPPATPLELPDALKENAGVRTFIEGYNTLPTAQNPCSPKAVAELLDLARDWSDHFGRPVHLGEFGSHKAADPESRARYAKDVRTLAEARNIPWALWDWKAGFGYWNAKTNEPFFRAALFE